VLQPPVDEEGFVESFNGLTEQRELREFFRKYGFVVIRDAVPEKTCSGKCEGVVCSLTWCCH